MAFQEPAEPVVREYLDAGGTARRVPPDVVVAFEEILAAGAGEAPLMAHPGNRLRGRGTVELEGGGEVDIDGAIPPDMPVGYHTFADDHGTRRLIVSPGRCALP